MVPTTYKLIHLCGVLMIFSGLVGFLGLFMTGAQVRQSSRITFAIVHGFGMLLVLVSGFGMAARLGYMATFPVWLILKIVIWLLLGASMVLAKRQASMAGGLVALWIFLGTAAAYLALFKPF